MDRLVVVGRKAAAVPLALDDGAGNEDGDDERVLSPLPAAATGVLENGCGLDAEDGVEAKAETGTVVRDGGIGEKREGITAGERDAAKEKKRTSRRESWLRIWKRMSAS